MHTLQSSKVIQPCIEDGLKLADNFDQSDAQNMDTDQLISQESSWPARWPRVPYLPSFSTAALEHQAAFPVDTSCARATGFSGFPPSLSRSGVSAMHTYTKEASCILSNLRNRVMRLFCQIPSIDIALINLLKSCMAYLFIHITSAD